MWMCTSSPGTNNPNWSRPSKSQQFFFLSFWRGRRRQMSYVSLSFPSTATCDMTKERKFLHVCGVGFEMRPESIKILDRTNVEVVKTVRNLFSGVRSDLRKQLNERSSFSPSSREWLKVSTCEIAGEFPYQIYCLALPCSLLARFFIAFKQIY